ncbi:single-strand DNA-binding protein [Barrientosiimonas humi]|uniref:Single-strand DNA-binding protein n=1 Tax=Barrientosiimonas humi TaxID=999931 RepID=A0A542XC77_9MICO|nr:single-stranded DNA-binding protein [Barrientosiimonas humi]TQL33429.1 single-strand DNA-binding protein [Barrientosiimonas humi]CAG7573417.1 Single-stranded DNA-binding protein [Barrientosiimonas humi]
MSAPAPAEAPPDLNEVRLVGRVSGEPAERVLPSGDPIVTLRVVVRRKASTARRNAAPVDTIDVACFSATTRRRAAALTADTVVEVEGSLRRRFFRTAQGAASRYEVEAASVRRVKG